jgi:1,4-dihydroxy-2-naphthoate octaprenyltransferase
MSATVQKTDRPSLKILFLETRPQFLLLSVVLAFLGAAIAWYWTGTVNIGYAILAGFGLLLTHTSVNVLNDYFDFKSGVDLVTKRTPFSGGSGILPPGLMKPKQVFWFGLISFLIAVPIGIYFTIVKGWQLLPLLLVAGLCVLIYTTVFLKMKWPEWWAGLGLGTLPILGAFFVQAGNYTIPAIVAAIPSGILVHNLLLLNEFPDIEADKTAKRQTSPIVMGGPKAAIFYSALTILVYVWVVGGVLFKMMPLTSLIALLTLPFAVKAIRGSMHYQDMSKLVPAMANNVLVVLVTQLLLGIGFILARAFNMSI